MLGTPVVTRSTMPTLGWSPDNVPSDWAARLPDDARPWVVAIESAAAQAGLDPRLLAAVVWSESGFRPDAVSSAGAIGLTQLMPGTAEGLGVDPADPVQNLNGGARFLASMIRRFDNLELGLAAYNAGPGRVEAANRIPDIPETQAYVPKVLTRYLMLGGAT
jgi:soluble lytic murein transglycosylase-like protein